MPPLTPFIEYTAAAIFALAILHTFCTKFFQHLAHTESTHSGLWKLLGEVEVVFGFWSCILLLVIAFSSSTQNAITYLENQNFTEALFVFVILTMAATSPVLYFVSNIVDRITSLLPVPPIIGRYFLCLSFIPLSGSFITEPAAMTVAALLLRTLYFDRNVTTQFKYATLAVLLVNISIGGVLTPYAAPPVLMVAGKWGWDFQFMSSVFGWKAAIAVMVNAFFVSLFFAKQLIGLSEKNAEQPATTIHMPIYLVIVHLLFIVATVYFSHHPVVFIGFFLFFLGFTHAYSEYQDKLMLKEGLLVGFFLAGLVVLGGLQRWWLQPLISDMQTNLLFFGAIGLTAVTDNAALTYLGSLVEGISEPAKYALVAGAVTGGGLTVIANAPNPAGFAILKDCFDEQSISPLYIFLAALLPTICAALCFWIL
jgi:hypothetical protein